MGVRGLWLSVWFRLWGFIGTKRLGFTDSRFLGLKVPESHGP